MFDGWMAKPTWAKAAKAANGRCAIVVTAFIEGITCRRPDDKVFFILALSIGDDSFVILTTDAKETLLLGERAKKSEGFGSGRCPLYADGAQAARWCASATAEDPAAVAAEIESEAKANALGLDHWRGQARFRHPEPDASGLLGRSQEGQDREGASSQDRGPARCGAPRGGPETPNAGRSRCQVCCSEGTKCGVETTCGAHTPARPRAVAAVDESCWRTAAAKAAARQRPRPRRRRQPRRARGSVHDLDGQQRRGDHRNRLNV